MKPTSGHLDEMAFRAELFQTGVLEVTPKNSPGNTNDPAVYDALQRQVEENNQILKELALEHDVALANTASLNDFPELFLDDCHFTVDGHKRRAEILYDTIVRLNVIDPEFSGMFTLTKHNVRII